MNKKDRLRVYVKYNGHCAYCGRNITYGEMQVDHLIPKRYVEIDLATQEEIDSFNNLMPSCSKCNHYKRAHSIETFRDMIGRIPEKLFRDNYIFNVGVI